jgi:hypothetical protein
MEAGTYGSEKTLCKISSDDADRCAQGTPKCVCNERLAEYDNCDGRGNRLRHSQKI